jgi:hypothetical protein
LHSHLQLSELELLQLPELLSLVYVKLDDEDDDDDEHDDELEDDELPQL